MKLQNLKLQQKDALDKAQNAGTDAIAADNPVVAKKDAAKSRC